MLWCSAFCCFYFSCSESSSQDDVGDLLCPADDCSALFCDGSKIVHPSPPLQQGMRQSKCYKAQPASNRCATPLHACLRSTKRLLGGNIWNWCPNLLLVQRDMSPVEEISQMDLVGFQQQWETDQRFVAIISKQLTGIEASIWLRRVALLKVKMTEAETKRLPFCRRHFQINLLVWQLCFLFKFQ